MARNAPERTRYPDAGSRDDVAITPSSIGDVEPDPRRPISAELEVLVEVHESRCLEIVEDVAQRGVVRNGTDHNELPVYRELIGCQVESFVDSGACDARALVRLALDEEHRLTCQNLVRHQ